MFLILESLDQIQYHLGGYFLHLALLQPQLAQEDAALVVATSIGLAAYICSTQPNSEILKIFQLEDSESDIEVIRRMITKTAQFQDPSITSVKRKFSYLEKMGIDLNSLKIIN